MSEPERPPDQQQVIDTFLAAENARLRAERDALLAELERLRATRDEQPS